MSPTGTEAREALSAGVCPSGDLVSRERPHEEEGDGQGTETLFHRLPHPLVTEHLQLHPNKQPRHSATHPGQSFSCTPTLGEKLLKVGMLCGNSSISFPISHHLCMMQNQANSSKWEPLHLANATGVQHGSDIVLEQRKVRPVSLLKVWTTAGT